MLLARICLVDVHGLYHETTLDVTHDHDATARGLALWFFMVTRRRRSLRPGPLVALWTVSYSSDHSGGHSTCDGTITGHGTRFSAHADIFVGE